MDNFKIKIFNSFTEELKECWEKFEKISNHYFFQSYKWQKLWFDHQKKYKRPIKNYSIVIEDNSEIIMIMPLNIDSSYGIKKLYWSGFPFSDYNCPLINKKKKIDEKSFLKIWNLILENKHDFDCIIFKNQPRRILYEKNPFFYSLNNNIENKSFGIDLKENFKLEKKEQFNINYQIKRLANSGELKFKIAENKEEINRIVNFIIKHKSKQYENTNAWNLFKIDVNKSFFNSSSLEFNKIMYITYLMLNEKIIAAHFGYIYNKRCYYLFPVYDYSYKKYSPGKILLKKIIDHCIANSLEYFDLTIGLEDYKKKYSNNENEISFYFKNINYKGIFFISILQFKELLKKIIK